MKRIKTERVITIGLVYVMMSTIFGMGMVMVPQQQEVQALMQIVPELRVIPNVEVPVENKEIVEPEIKIEANINELLEPVPVRYAVIKDAAGLNIRENGHEESDIWGVVYKDEVMVVHNYREGQKWVSIGDGYVNAEYIEFRDDIVIDDSYVFTEKGTYTPELRISNVVTDRSYISMKQLLSLTEGTALAGIEQSILDVEAEIGINGLFVYAVARHESASGTSLIARDKNNLFGLNAQDHDPYNLAFSYSNHYDSVYDFARIIKDYYIDLGLTDIDSISMKYCTDLSWGEGIYRIMNESYNKLNG